MASLMTESQVEVTTSMRHSVQMHREMLDDYVRDFGRTKVCEYIFGCAKLADLIGKCPECVG